MARGLRSLAAGNGVIHCVWFQDQLDGRPVELIVVGLAQIEPHESALLLQAIGDTGLGEEIRDVVSDGPVAQDETPRDLGVRPSVRHPGQDFFLARGQPCGPIPARGSRACNMVPSPWLSIVTIPPSSVARSRMDALPVSLPGAAPPEPSSEISGDHGIQGCQNPNQGA